MKVLTEISAKFGKTAELLHALMNGKNFSIFVQKASFFPCGIEGVIMAAVLIEKNSRFDAQTARFFTYGIREDF